MMDAPIDPRVILNAPAPQPNLNGTSRDELLSQHEDVMLALRDLTAALARSTPHGRDFPAGNWQQAINGHRLAFQAIHIIETAYTNRARQLVDGEV